LRCFYAAWGPASVSRHDCSPGQGRSPFRISTSNWGDLDSDGFLKGRDGVRAGLREIRYTFHIRTDADEEKVREFAVFVKSRCPVNDSLLGHVPITPQGIVISR